MIEFNWLPLTFGFIMAGIDVFMLGVIKKISLDRARFLRYMVLPTIVYAIQPWIFLESLKFETMIVMNLVWDMVSDVLVTILGFTYFKERLSYERIVGISLSFLSIFFLGVKSGSIF